MRYPILDGFRGFFLVFMAIVHGNVFDSIFGKINHHYFGWVEDAQGFIFISGLVVGLVYSGIMNKKGDDGMHLALRKRMKTIYTYQAGLIVAMLLVALILGGNGPEILSSYAANPVSFTTSSLLLLSSSLHMGILPMYLFFMLATPWALKRFRDGQTIYVFGISAMCWLFAQTGLLEVAAAAAGQTSFGGETLELGHYFNIFGWQVIYMVGLYIGYQMANKQFSLDFMRTAQMEKLFYACIGAILLLAVYDWTVGREWISGEYTDMIVSRHERPLFGPLYLIAFFIDLFAISWLLVAGAESRHGVIRLASDGMRWFFNLRFFTFLGQHSLQVFAFHIVLVYGIHAWYDGGNVTVGLIEGGLILLALVLSMLIPAYIHAQSMKRRKRKLVNVARTA